MSIPDYDPKKDRIPLKVILIAAACMIAACLLAQFIFNLFAG
jgi:Na+-translocating ferredoxin:NAD+ oxidoreductase RnfE subunit